MEEWQRESIKSHLAELLQDTRCNEMLLAHLIAKKILSTAEKDYINSTAVQVQKADKLYEILPSREGAYNILVSALKATNQSGVAKILEDADCNHPMSVALKECTEGLFSYRIINPLFLTSNLKFESVRQAIASYVDLNIIEMVFDIKKAMKPWLLRGPCNETLLHISVAYGNTRLIKYLISIGVLQNSTDMLGRTPLHYTGKFSTNILETTKLFLSEGQHFYQFDKDGMTMATTLASYGTINQLHYHHWANHMIKNKYMSVYTQKCKAGCTPLHRLMEHLDLEKTTIEMILKAGNININLPDNQGHTILHCALMFGRSLKLIKNLLDLGADYKLISDTKVCALHFAVKGGHKEVITFLILLQLDINKFDDFGETPLHKARYTRSRDYLGMTAFLLDNGANFLVQDKHKNTFAHLFALAAHISSEDFQIWADGMIKSGHGHIFAIRGQNGRTSLQNAIQRLDLDLATLTFILKSSKVDIDQQDDDGYTLLHLALVFGRSLETIKNLVSLGANIEIKDKRGSRLLHCAVGGGNKDVIQYLISQGFDVNEKNSIGNSPLHFVFFSRPKRYVELTKLLLDYGADMYSKDKYGNTVAYGMAIAEYVSCDDIKVWVTAMIENGHAHLFTMRGFNGRTPLHWSMMRLDVALETIKLIIETAKLDINQPDNQGSTILHLAVRFGRSLDTIKSLVELGADWKRKGMFDCSVMHSVVEASNREAFLFFKSLGADVHAKDKFGETPLHYVRFTKSKDYLGMTQFLLDNGANLNAKDKDGRTLDHFFSSEKHISVEEYAVWKAGMIKMGHAEFFYQESV